MAGETERRLLKKSEYAKHRGVSPAMVTHWLGAGRLVLDVSGKRVDVVASDAALAGSLDPSRGGKGGGPNAKRIPRGEAAAGGVQDAAPPADGPGPGRHTDPNSPTSRFTEHRATREGFVAKEAELRYLERAGALVSLDVYEAAIRAGMGPIVAAVDSLAPRIAQTVIGLTDPRAVEAAIEKEIETIRADLIRALSTLLSEPDKVRQ